MLTPEASNRNSQSLAANYGLRRDVPISRNPSLTVPNDVLYTRLTRHRNSNHYDVIMVTRRFHVNRRQRNDGVPRAMTQIA